MKTFIRAMALVASMAGFAASAQAAVVLNFEDEPVNPDTGMGGAPASQFGITFSGGGIVLRDSLWPVSSGSTRVLFNGVPGGSILLTIDPTFQYDLLNFDFSVADAGLQYDVTDDNGAHFAAFRDINPTGGNWVWGKHAADLQTLGKIRSIEFRAGSSSANFAIDNISFSLNSTGGGLHVPEPASLMLVGLALAGVAASRRRAKA